ncbi:MAG: hypothetical protein P1U67_12705 [Alcanivoracaceae bacterium]|nr:hypothetical protein [Alcanivoracaceae bacterium]
MKKFIRLFMVVSASMFFSACAARYDIYLPSGEQVTQDMVEKWQSTEPQTVLPYRLGTSDFDSYFALGKGSKKYRAGMEKRMGKIGAQPELEIALPVIQGWMDEQADESVDIEIRNLGLKGGINRSAHIGISSGIAYLVTLGFVPNYFKELQVWELAMSKDGQLVSKVEMPIATVQRKGWFPKGTFQAKKGVSPNAIDVRRLAALQSQQNALNYLIDGERNLFPEAVSGQNIAALADAINSPELRILRLDVETRLLKALENNPQRLPVLASVMDYAEFIQPQLSPDEQLLLSGPSGHTVYELLAQLKQRPAEQIAAEIQTRKLPYTNYTDAQKTKLRQLGLPDAVIASMVGVTEEGHRNVVVACAKGYAAVKICEKAPSDPFGLVRRACLYGVKKQFGDVQCPVPLF